MTKKDKQIAIEKLKLATRKELAEILYGAYYDKEYNYIDLTELDFMPYDCDVDISQMKVKGDLWQNCQNVKDILWQNYQTVEGNLWQDNQTVKGNLGQNGQNVEGDLYQNGQNVKGKIFQDKLESGKDD